MRSSSEQPAPLRIEAHSDAHSEAVLEAYREFFESTLDSRLAPRPGEIPAERALNLFRAAAEEVPAYRSLLASRGIDPSAVRTPEDFAGLPLVTKDNYVRQYPLSERCWGGKLERCEMIAVSSGSTGTPLFWPRSIRHELETAARFEQVFNDSFGVGERSTLAVVCFTLGTWVGGMFTAACCRALSQKGYPITLVTPGNNKDEIYRCVRELGPAFDQVVLLGYPPFLKDVIDTGIARGIDWEPRLIKLVMAGEVFSEEWRTLVGKRTGSTEICHDSASIYGTADAGVLANETPLSISIRRFLAGRPDASRQLFGESRLPTLAQYDPYVRYFEEQGGTLLFTGDSGAPLIRYHIADAGGLVPYDRMVAFLRDWGFEAPMDGPRRELPFVYVFGRADFTVSYFGANIYPENITVGLEQDPLTEWVSGKFVLQVTEDDERDSRLEVVVEMLPGVDRDADRRHVITQSILSHLLRLNSEFAHYTPPHRQEPHVILALPGDPEYFPPGVKHRYTRRTPTARQEK